MLSSLIRIHGIHWDVEHCCGLCPSKSPGHFPCDSKPGSFGIPVNPVTPTELRAEGRHVNAWGAEDQCGQKSSPGLH